VIAFVVARPGVTTSPAHLAQMLAQGREARVRAVVHEPHAPDDASRWVAQKLDVPLLTLALSVGSMPGTNDYFALFDYNVTTLAKALGARR